MPNEVTTANDAGQATPTVSLRRITQRKGFSSVNNNNNNETVLVILNIQTTFEEIGFSFKFGIKSHKRGNPVQVTGNTMY